MVPLSQLTAETVYSDEVFEEVFSEEDDIYRARLILSLQDRAAELGRKKQFEEMLKAYKKKHREHEREERARKKSSTVSLLENWTNFTDCPYGQMECKNWIASDSGVFISNPNPGAPDILACYHPILPVGRLRNLETGEERIKIGYKDENGNWQEKIFDKSVIASSNKIVALAGQGIGVTSETAKYLVRYLADVEYKNRDDIKTQYSTSKLGWGRYGDFLPYDTEVIFDGDYKFHAVYDSIRPHGDYETWKNHVRELRQTGRLEVKFLLAASFSSILIKKIGALPFFVDLWGDTEGGKTVSLMVAASVWADPDESRYIGDFKTTDVALETKADMLNNLPMFLDDTSKVSKKIADNFEGIVYDMCSGKGKSRSNKELGINRENRWSTCFICNGERLLSGYVNQGGAVNRILEVKAYDNIFVDPQKTCEIIKNNYGYAGKEFVEIVKRISPDELKKLVKDFQRKLLDESNMQKQVISLSIVLAADKLIEEYIFKDNCTISINEAKSVLVSRVELSENIRAYKYIMDMPTMHPDKFTPIGNPSEFDKTIWGEDKGDCILFIPAAFEVICKEGNFSRKSFTGWAMQNDLLDVTKGRGDSKQYRYCIDGIWHTKTVICVKKTDDIEAYMKDRKREGKVLIGEQEELVFD